MYLSRAVDEARFNYECAAVLSGGGVRVTLLDLKGQKLFFSRRKSQWTKESGINLQHFLVIFAGFFFFFLPKQSLNHK